MSIDTSDMTSGTAREFRRVSRMRMLLFLLAMIAIFGIGGIQAVKTCQGFNGVRAGLNDAANQAQAAAVRALDRSRVDTGQKHDLDLRAYRADMVAAQVRFDELDCSLPFPETR